MTLRSLQGNPAEDAVWPSIEHWTWLLRKEVFRIEIQNRIVEDLQRPTDGWLLDALLTGRLLQDNAIVVAPIADIVRHIRGLTIVHLSSLIEGR